MNAPEKATEIKAIFAAFFAFCTAIWGWVGWAIIALAFCIVLDYLTGTWAAKAHGEWSSAIARQGLWHKLGEIVALLVAILCDIAINVILNSSAAPLLEGLDYHNYITLIVCMWYIFTELGSIMENAQKLGAPIPDWLIKGITSLKTQTENKVDLFDNINSPNVQEYVRIPLSDLQSNPEDETDTE